MIGGQEYRVSSTYFLAFPDGVQFTIDYPYDFSVPLSEFTNEQALEIALPLMRHAYESGLHRRIQVNKVGSGSVETNRIGVVLLESQEKSQQGYRVRLTIEEIRSRIEQSDP